MPINVFDTPGFYDSNICQNEENKRVIASQIENEIDVFAYFMDPQIDRMDGTTQAIFTRLNEWTNGNIWNNLVLVYARTHRSDPDQLDRAMMQNSIIKEKNAKLSEIRRFLTQMAKNNNWKRSIQRNDGQEVLRTGLTPIIKF